MAKLREKKIKKGIKKEELEAIYKTLFDLMDENHDGVLEPTEFKEFMNANYELHGV
jgi:Ca2+-binding EF-hand superfamily protein